MGKGSFVFRLANSAFFSSSALLRALQEAKKKERPNKQELYVAFGPEDMGVGLVIKVPRHPEWVLVLPTDPDQSNLECTFTIGIVSRAHIWNYIRDVLTIICQGVPLAFEFKYEDHEDDASEFVSALTDRLHHMIAHQQGWFDFKEDKFLVRRVLAGQGPSAEAVMGVGGAIVVGSGYDQEQRRSDGMRSARNALLPPAPSELQDDERNRQSAAGDASLIAGVVRRVGSHQPVVSATTLLSGPGAAGPSNAGLLRVGSHGHGHVASAADILSMLPPPKASVPGAPVIVAPKAPAATPRPGSVISSHSPQHGPSSSTRAAPHGLLDQVAPHLNSAGITTAPGPHPSSAPPESAHSVEARTQAGTAGAEPAHPYAPTARALPTPMHPSQVTSGAQHTAAPTAQPRPQLVATSSSGEMRQAGPSHPPSYMPPAGHAQQPGLLPHGAPVSGGTMHSPQPLSNGSVPSRPMLRIEPPSSPSGTPPLRTDAAPTPRSSRQVVEHPAPANPSSLAGMRSQLFAATPRTGAPLLSPPSSVCSPSQPATASCSSVSLSSSSGAYGTSATTAVTSSGGAATVHQHQQPQPRTLNGSQPAGGRSQQQSEGTLQHAPAAEVAGPGKGGLLERLASGLRVGRLK